MPLKTRTPADAETVAGLTGNAYSVANRSAIAGFRPRRKTVFLQGRYYHMRYLYVKLIL
jgi:hypothetical protein